MNERCDPESRMHLTEVTELFTNRERMAVGKIFTVLESPLPAFKEVTVSTL